MSHDNEAAPRSVRGRQLACPICKGTQFFTRAYLLNTRVATFFNFDWANRSAHTFICEQCGHIMWFAAEGEGES
ncbi:MAG: DNA-binding protein [Acidobacteria bacterium]|nr:DNA-binding protein [Acidobacteriota bacterium]